MPKKYMNYARTQELIYGIRRVLSSPVKIVTWADGTDEEICACIEALDNGDITTEDLGWEVGDQRDISLNAIEAGDYNVAHAAQDHKLVIYEVDNYNGVGHYIVGLLRCLAEGEKMQSADSNSSGWHNSRGRKCCDALFNMIPSTLQPIFKTFTVTTATKGNSNTPGTTDQSGKLALLAEKEIFGSKGGCCQDEVNSSKVHSQLEWFKTTANRKKRRGGTNVYWWERSPYSGNSINYCCVGTAGGSNSQAPYSSSVVSFSPFGVI